MVILTLAAEERIQSLPALPTPPDPDQDSSGSVESLVGLPWGGDCEILALAALALSDTGSASVCFQASSKRE